MFWLTLRERALKEGDRGQLKSSAGQTGGKRSDSNTTTGTLGGKLSKERPHHGYGSDWSDRVGQIPLNLKTRTLGLRDRQKLTQSPIESVAEQG